MQLRLPGSSCSVSGGILPLTCFAMVRVLLAPTMQKDFPLGQAQGRTLIGWFWSQYPSLDQSLWPPGVICLTCGGDGVCARRKKKRDTEQTVDHAPGPELLQPWE